MGELRNVFVILVGNPERKRQLGRSRRRWEDSTNIDNNKVEVEGCGLESTGSG
jgi:hypothetical protein